tara:strand:+ start:224 stop:598 length:375 start_codon:yes stop_codon:yes gene_type:complete
MSFVYFIESTNGSTYIGATINLDKRIRQHNKEISGGAKATSIRVNQGEIWQYICYVENFPSYNEALKFEWRWKQISRRIQKNNPFFSPREKRLAALKELLNLKQSTLKAIPYQEWDNPPNIIYI